MYMMMIIAVMENGKMDDYISRQAAIAILDRWLSVNGYSEGEINVMRCMKFELEDMPSADVQPVRHGHWNWFDGVYCSVCNYKLQSTGIPSYCPNCGAQMDEGSE